MSKSVVTELGRNVDAAVDEAVQDLEQVREDIAERTKRAADAIHQLASDARERTRAVARTTADTVRERPIASVAIAGGIAVALGFVISRLVRRKSRPIGWSRSDT